MVQKIKRFEEPRERKSDHTKIKPIDYYYKNYVLSLKEKEKYNILLFIGQQNVGCVYC